MPEKVEWEIVDEQPADIRPSLREILKKMLGARWRWKVAGVAAVTGFIVVLLAVITGMIALLMSALAILSFGIGRIRHVLRRGQAATSVTRS